MPRRSAANHHGNISELSRNFTLTGEWRVVTVECVCVSVCLSVCVYVCICVYNGRHRSRELKPAAVLPPLHYRYSPVVQLSPSLRQFIKSTHHKRHFGRRNKDSERVFRINYLSFIDLCNYCVCREFGGCMVIIYSSY